MTSNPEPSPADLDRIVTIWSRVVQTQEHFNDICMRVRTLYATVIAAIIASYGVLIENSKQSFALDKVEIDALVPLTLAASLAAYLFYFVDRHWYHSLLLGAVAQGAEIEAKWAHKMPEMQLGSKILEKSPVSLERRPVAYLFARMFVRDKRLRSERKIHSDAKVEIFYKPVARLMLLAFLLFSLFGGIEYRDRNLFSLAQQAICSAGKG
jgi:hypothetical protein